MILSAVQAYAMPTIHGSLQRKDLGKTIGVDVERTTGFVSQSDLETQVKLLSDQSMIYGWSVNDLWFPLVTIRHLTHMDLVIDFSFQKWTQEPWCSVLSLSE